MQNLRLVIFDMAGTTVRDKHEVEACFAQAAQQTGLAVSPERIRSVQGLAKRFVFEMLWQEQTGLPVNQLEDRIELSYQTFRSILENHYHTQAVAPTTGCLALFDYLRTQRISIGLTTGFYRQVTDVILQKLGWLAGLDENYMGNASTIIQCSVCSDEVPEGRPSPQLIERTMQLLGITDPQQVMNIGDTPADLESGKRAGCARSIGVINGTHTHAQLSQYPNDGLYDSLAEVQQLLETTRQLQVQG